MIRYIFISTCVFCSQFSQAQSFSAPSLNVDMQNLYKAYLHDFKTIWGKRKMATDKEIVYHSNYRVTGSVDRTNFVIYNKLDKTFSFTAVMDSAFVRAAALNDAFKKVQLPVGKLKEVEDTISTVNVYEVADRKTAPFKAKRLIIMVTTASGNVCLENGREYSFKIIPVIGNEDK